MAVGSTSNIIHDKLDNLGEFIKLDTNFYIRRDSWEDLFHAVKGGSNFSNRLRHLKHRAKPPLQRIARHGIPVLLTTKAWTLEQKDRAMQRGNHPSTLAFAPFIQSKMKDMKSKGMFIVLPYHLVRNLKPLQISPLGCIPQRERRPRIINNYTYSGVNPATVKMVPEEAMQWGRTLHRVLWYIFSADTLSYCQKRTFQMGSINCISTH